MSAGDIIDRAVRLYRRNFLALLRIVVAPSLVAYAGLVLMSIGWRNLTLSRGDTRVVVTVVMMLGGAALLVIGKAAFYAFLGGSARSLVAHFFEGQPIRARDVYRAVRERIWSLIGATLLMGLLILGIMIMAYFFITIIAMVIFAVLMATVISELPTWLQTIISLGMGLIMLFTLALAALLVYSRVVYVPQILMVEGKGVFSSVSRSFALASGQIRRIAALFLFWVVVGWSVLWLLFVPLETFAYWMGVDITPLNPNAPVWYGLAQQTVAQISEILLMPIAMLGYTLLYLDSRVRKEGYDVELLANRTLASPPQPIYSSMPQYAFESQPQPSPQSLSDRSPFTTSILGLDDYRYTPTTSVPEQDASIASSPDQEIDPTYTPAPAPDFATMPSGAEKEAEIEAGNEARAQESVEFAPVDALTPATEHQQPAIVSAYDPAFGSARKSCRWCGAEATVEDRFCRVCGSVF
jgi:hypothetical protein